MMRYTVIWVSDASDELAEIWMAATDRNAIAVAADAIDVALADDPQEKGLPLREGLRVLVHSPLRVIFTVIQDDLKVQVASVQRA